MKATIEVTVSGIKDGVAKFRYPWGQQGTCHIGYLTITDPDWKTVPLGTNVEVRDHDEQEWQPARWVAYGTLKMWPYAILFDDGTLHHFTQCRLAGGQE